MALTLVRGSTQILDGSITWAKIAAGAIVPTSSLVDGANFLKKDGSVAMTASLNAGGFPVTNAGNPVAATDLVNLQTLQTFVNGFGVARGARTLVSTNVVSLSGVQNFNGLTGAAGDIVWLNAQTTASQNGFWQMNAGAWTRPTQWAAASSQKSFQLFIQEGTGVADTKWTVAADAIVVDTTAVSAVQDTTGATYTADTTKGIALTGNAFSVKLAAASGLGFDGTGNVQVVPNGTSLNVSATGVKIADGAAGQIMVANPGATFTTLSGDATLSGTGVLTLATGVSGVVKAANDVFNELPTGTINGANATFTLAAAPLTGKQAVYLNGVRLNPGAGNDYTISGATITMLTIPQTGDVVLADYLK
jgi:hypothetical protein